MTPDPSSPSRTPSPIKWGYILGWSLCAAGAVVFLVAIATVVLTSLRGVVRVPVPGETAVSLTSGLYVGVYQHKGDDAPPAQALAALQVSVRDPASGQALPLLRVPGARVPSLLGPALVLFQTEAPDGGDYRVVTAYPEGVPGPRTEINLVHESVQSNRADLVVGFIVFIVLAGFGVYTVLKTSRQEDELKKAGQPKKVSPPQKPKPYKK